MRRMRKMGLFFLLVVPAMMSLNPVWGETVNRVVAIVNDEIITLHELNRKIEEMTGQNPSDLRLRDPNGFLETRRQVLELLIDEKIAQDKIEELGINVTEKRIEAAIEKIKENNQWTHEDLLESLEQQGISYKKFKENIKTDIERFKLIDQEVKSKILVTDEMIKDYYQKHSHDFDSEGKVHIASIFLVRKNPGDEQETRRLFKRGEEILARLKGGTDFAELARQFSQGPGADEGGDMGTFKMVQLDPELKKICDALSEGDVSDLIVRGNGIQIIKVLEKQEGRVKTLEESRNAIYSILYKEEVNKKYLSWIKDLRENSYIKMIF